MNKQKNINEAFSNNINSSYHFSTNHKNQSKEKKKANFNTNSSCVMFCFEEKFKCAIEDGHNDVIANKWFCWIMIHTS